MKRAFLARRAVRWRAIALGAAIAAGYAPAARAQVDAGANPELKLLQQAGALETAGDLDGSERVLRSILSTTPTSLSALISLERILAMQGKTADLIPALDRLLDRDTKSPVGHQMRVRALSALDRVEELEAAAEQWIAVTPKIETPYREIARVWRQRNELTKAVSVLELGRSRIRRPDALALELGDVYAEAGDYRSAVREWNRAIGSDGHGFLLVQRRTMNLADGGAAVIPQLVDALSKPPTTIPRQRAAAQLAIDAGLDAKAEVITRGVASALEDAQRQRFLVEVARRSDGAGLDDLAYWAYGELVSAGGPLDQMLALRTRLAELALAVGDTVSAAATYRELERAYAVGSPQRRQAVAVRIELLARERDTERARTELSSFRSEFTDAPELDGVAAAVANALIDTGDHGAAQDVLAGVNGPRSGLALSRILIARGEVERARNELLTSAPALHGPEATEAIALAALLGRLSQQGGELVAKAMTNVAAGEREDAIDLLSDASKSLSDGERATILEFAAQLADRAEFVERAEQIRREIITEYPRSREAPGATLSIARSLTVEDRAPEEAKLLLENLILEHPRSALVPQARRELDRLLGRIPPAGASSAPSSHLPQR